MFHVKPTKRENQMEAIAVPQLEIGLAGRAKELCMVAEEFKIVDEKTLGEAADLIRQILAAWKSLDDERDSYVRPLFTAEREYNNQFKAVQDPLRGAETTLKKLMKVFQREQQVEHQRKEAELARQQREAEAVAAELNEPPPPPPPPPPPKPGPVRGAYGSKAILKEKWVHEVDDITMVPLKYLQVNDAAVKQAIKDGARDGAIPGIKIYDEGTVAVS